MYIGAVMVLFLFGIMLTRAQIGRETGLNNPGWALGIPVALVLFGLLAWVILDAFGDDVLPDSGPTPTEALSDRVPVHLPPALPRVVLRPARGCHRRHRPGV